MSTLAVIQVGVVAALISVLAGYLVIFVERSRSSGFVESLARGDRRGVGPDGPRDAMDRSGTLAQSIMQQIPAQYHGEPATMTNDLVALANHLGRKTETGSFSGGRHNSSFQDEHEQDSEIEGSLVPVRLRSRSIPNPGPHGPKAA